MSLWLSLVRFVDVSSEIFKDSKILTKSQTFPQYTSEQLSE